RRGGLLGGVSVSAAQKDGVRSLASRLAFKLRRRIGLVLAGKVGGPPVPLPGRAKAGPPPNGLDLSALALRPSDVGRAKVSHQGYKLDTDLNPISEYERELSPAGEFGYLQEEVALFHSPTEASYTFGILGEGLSSSSFM